MLDETAPADRSSTLTYHCLVNGHVQGVGFRRWTKRCAKSLGIAGWVRNRGSGQVELMFTASPADSEIFLEKLHDGPPRSIVSGVIAKEVRPRSFQKFKIQATRGQTEQDSSKLTLLQNVHFDAAFAKLCQRMIEVLPAELRRPNRVSDVVPDWGFQQLEDAAHELGLVPIRLGKGAPRQYLLETPGRPTGLNSTRLSSVSYLETVVANDKMLTLDALRAVQLPVPQGSVTNTVEQALGLFQKSSYPVVLKPSHGSNSDGVTTNVNDQDGLLRAFERAQAMAPDRRVVVEEYVRGVDLRILTVGDKVVVAYLRLPANVIGDGVSTVAELVDAKNEARTTLPGIGLKNPVPLDALAHSLLSQQGLNLQSIPADERFVLLGLRPNTSDGADQVPVTDIMHPEIISACEKAAQTLGGTSLWGFDMLSEDFTAPLNDARTVFCEANNRPYGGVFRHSTHGPYTNFFQHALQELAPNKLSNIGDRLNWTITTPEKLSMSARDLISSCAVTRDAENSSILHLENILRSEALDIYRQLIEHPELSGRIVLEDTSRAFPSLAENPLIDALKGTTQAPLEVEADLTSAVAQAMGKGAEPWRDQIICRPSKGRIDLFDTLAPASFASALLRPRHLLAQRNLMGVAGIPMVHIVHIENQEQFSTLQKTGQLWGRLHFNDRWKNRWKKTFNPQTDFAELQFPKSVFPIRMEQWEENISLDVVAIDRAIVAAGLRDDQGLKTFDTVPADLHESCLSIVDAVPDLGRARLVFRKCTQFNNLWRLQCITADLDHVSFSRPVVGPPIDLASVIAQRCSQKGPSRSISEVGADQA